MSSFEGNEFRGGDYQFIANGVFGDVYRVENLDGSGCYAVKRSKKMHASRFQRASIMREVQVMQLICTGSVQSQSQCCCPHLVDFQDFWELEDRVYIKMSFEAKGSLRDMVKSSFFPDASVFHILHDISSALRYMHDTHKMVHLDLKPSNVLVSVSGHVKLCDFGKTVSIQSPSDDDEGDTRYMAKELLDCATYVPSADVYSCGIMMYEVCFANVPLEACPVLLPLPFELLPETGHYWHVLRSGTAPMPTFRNPMLVEILRAMMSPEPATRPTMAAVMASDLVSAAASYEDTLLLSAPTFIPVSFRDQRSDSFDPLVMLDDV